MAGERAGGRGWQRTVPPRPSLSPSRAGDFLTCPLLYRFRVIDRLPEPPSPAAVRGTLVHAVLERLFDDPAAEPHPGGRPGAAGSRNGTGWLAAEPELAGLFGDDEERGPPGSARSPPCWTATSPWRTRGGSSPPTASCACRPTLASGLRLRGYIDRLDVAPGGEMRIVDYKTGTAPPAEFEARALFQMKFYALVLWRAQGARAAAAPADVPGQRRDRPVRAGRGGPARHRAQGRGAVAGHRAGPGRTGTGGPGRAGSATGARTSRSARRSAAPRPSCPT